MAHAHEDPAMDCIHSSRGIIRVGCILRRTNRIDLRRGLQCSMSISQPWIGQRIGAQCSHDFAMHPARYRSSVDIVIRPKYSSRTDLQLRPCSLSHVCHQV